MAEKTTEKKKPAAKTKKPSRNLVTKSKKYKEGKHCPRCGEGFRLAEHKDRRSCGKCNYTEKK